MGNQTGNGQRENDNKTAVVVVGVNHLVADPNSPFTYLTARRGLYPVSLYAVRCSTSYTPPYLGTSQWNTLCCGDFRYKQITLITSLYLSKESESCSPASFVVLRLG